MAATFIYKPATYKGPVVLTPDTGSKTPPTITLPNGQVITGQYFNTNEGRHQFIFPRELYNHQNLQIGYDGQTGTIASGTISYEGNDFASWQGRDKGSLGYDPYTEGNYNQYGMLPNPYMMDFDPVRQRRNIRYNPISYTPIGYDPMETAPYQFTDPIEAARRYNEFNLGQEQQAYNIGRFRGQELTDLDTRATEGFARRMSGLQQDLVAQENKFNQAQRLQAVDFAMPDLRSTLDAKRQRGETYASGRLLSSAEDRAYQVAAQSASADGSFVRGFGDDSVFGRRTSDTLSAQQRLGISQMGESLLNDWVSQGSSILIDSPLKTSISQRLPSTPQILPSQQAAQQQSNLTNLTTVPLQFGISSEINQNQFGANLEQGTRQFNTANQLGVDQFNAGNQLGTDQFNAGNQLNTRMFNRGNRMAIDQFNASGQFQASQAQFSGLQSNYGLATQAYNRAQDIARQDAQNQAASIAADRNINNQNAAGNAGALGQIGGAIVGAAITAATGVPVGAISGGGGGGGGAAPGGASLSGITGNIPIGQNMDGSAIMGPRSASMSATTAPAQVGGTEVSGGPAPIAQAALSGAPLQYQGASIPVASSPVDSGITAADVSTGYQQAGGLITNVGDSGAYTPQISSLGRGLVNGGTAAQNITGSFQTASTPEAKMMLATELEGAALSNAGNPEDQVSVNKIFAQVREHLDTGVGINGQAAGIAGFIQNYNDYSGPEKARAITNISFAGQDLEGNYGVKDLSAESIGQQVVPGTGGKMTMQDAISLSNSGYNVSSLVNNWDDISEVHSTLNDKNNVLSVAATARSLRLLDNDTPESIRNKQMSLRQVSATPAGAWGAGAVAVSDANKGAVADVGMTVIGKTTDGQNIAVPIASAASAGLSTGVVGSGIDPRGLKDLPPQNLAIGQGAARVYQSWNQDYIPKQQGSMGASPAVANGLYQLGNSDPFLLGNILLGNLEKNGAKGSGKSLDGLKAVTQELGLSDSELTLPLANGEMYKGDDASFKVDHTKDLHRVMNLPGTALSTLVFGEGDDDGVKQMGNYFTNASVSKAPDSSLNQDNFENSQMNLQGFFKRAGISSKGEAYALSNQLIYEGRISQTQLVTVQQGINLTFDKNGFQAANQLLEGVKLSR